MNGAAMESNAPTLGFLLHDVARLLRRRFEQNPCGPAVVASSSNPCRSAKAVAAAQARRGHPHGSARRSAGRRHRAPVEDITGIESKSDGRMRFAGCGTKESEPCLIRKRSILPIPVMEKRALARRRFIVLTAACRLQTNGRGQPG